MVTKGIIERSLNAGLKTGDLVTNSYKKSLAFTFFLSDNRRLERLTEYLD